MIILAVAALIATGLYALTGNASQTSAQRPDFGAASGISALAANPRTGAPAPGLREERDEGGGAFGLLELVKNIGVIGLVIIVYWFGQKWIELSKHRPRLAM